MSEPDVLPRWVEVRVGKVTTRHFVDYDRVLTPGAMTVPAYLAAAARAILALEASLIERTILEGHDRFEIQIDGRPSSLHLLPTWRHPRDRLRVKWARWRRRHPEAGTRLLEAMAWSGTVWSAAFVPPRTRR